VPEDPRAHYAVRVTDMPPTEIACKCGQVFTGDDPIGQIKAHMDELNDARRA
jgi:hypothetical protein